LIGYVDCLVAARHPVRHPRRVTPSTSPIDVRPAQPQESGPIGDLTVAAYHAGGHLSPGSTYESVLRDVFPRLDRTLIAQRAGQLVGAISVFDAGHPMSELASQGEWEIRFLAVRSDSWGGGVARALMASAEARAREEGGESVVLYVIDRNERALQFYPRLGYRRVADRDWSSQSSCGVEGQVNLLAFAKDMR
jgi:ribosomal protein S18 acetylase RimI-like enzyme